MKGRSTLQLENHLHRRVLQRQGLAERADMLVRRQLARVQHAIANGELAGVPGPALRQGAAIEFFLEEEWAVLSEHGFEASREPGQQQREGGKSEEAGGRSHRWIGGYRRVGPSKSGEASRR